jgi:serpin B
LGARGDTATTLGKVLGLPAEETHAAVGSLLLQSSGGKAIEEHGEKLLPHELTVANSLWVAKSYELESTFRDQAVALFGSAVEDIDVTKPEQSAKQINDWTANKTRDKIKDLVPPSSIGPLTRLVIVNAVYLKAAWRESFIDGLTAPAPFFTEAGPKVDVPTMHLSDHVMRAEDAAVQVIELPYLPAQGAELAMVLVLPKQKDGLAAVESGLTAERFDGWIGTMSSTFVDISLPKFRIETAVRLREPLSKVGLSDLFEKPDLTGISSEEGLHVDEVIHKTYIDVDEEGTEAAAATAIMMEGAGMPPEPVAFNADHPFLYAIREKKTGAILFIGRVADPS